MSYNPPSGFEQEEFQEELAKYEKTISGKLAAYFDADQLADFASHYASKGKYKKAFEVTEYALGIHPGSTEILVIKAHILIDLGKKEEAKKIAFSIPESYNRGVQLLKAELLLSENRKEEVDELIKQIEEDGDNDDLEEKYADLAYLFMDADMPEQALIWFKKLLEQSPDNTETRMDMAECYSEANQPEKAISIYNKLLDEDPYSTEYWHELGKLYYSLEDYEKALEACSFILTIDNNHLGATLIEAHCYFKLENFKKAGEIYLGYAEQAKEPEIPFFFVGLCFYFSEKFEEALNYFLQSLNLADSLSIELTDIYEYIALSYGELNDFDKAILYIDKAIERDKSYPKSHINKGHFLIKQDKDSEAYASFINAISIDPTNSQLYLDIAKYCFGMKKYKEALLVLDSLENIDPGYETAYIYQALLHYFTDNKQKFEEYMNKAFEKNSMQIFNFLKEIVANEDPELKSIIEDMEELIGNTSKVMKKKKEEPEEETDTKSELN